MDELNDQPPPERETADETSARAKHSRARGAASCGNGYGRLSRLSPRSPGLFLAFSWAGHGSALPPLARAIGLFSSIRRCRRGRGITAGSILRLPSIYDGLRRLDRSSGETHRPATAVADHIAANSQDPVAQALWRAHVEHALLSARKFKARWPTPRLSLRDPMAFRALVLILVVASFFAAGGERSKRIAAAFDLARCRCAGKFPHRRVGHAAGLHRPATRHASRSAAR